MSMSSILVTGGSGFIGKEIIKHLEWVKYRPVNFDISNRNNLLCINQLEKYIKNTDMIIHIAAQANFMEMENLLGAQCGVEINVVGTHNVAYLCAKHKKPLIYGSTVCTYGNIETIGKENSALNPSDLYAYSKLAGENIILGYAKTFGLEYIILRFATTYGPGIRSELGVHKFITAAKKNLPLRIHGNGKQTRTQTHVYDIASGVVKAVQRFNKAKNNIINLSASKQITAKKMAKDIIKQLNSKSKIVNIDQRKNQTFYERFSTDKAKKLLKWSPVYSWEKGIKNTIEWFISAKDERHQLPFR